jgi:hypothetical protein
MLTCTQGFQKDFENAGFKIEVKQLADFQDAYGLEGGEDDEDIEVSGSDDDDDDSESGSEMEE